MNLEHINRIFDETAYIRTGGSNEELECAKYLVKECEKLGLSAEIVPFEVQMATMKKASLFVDGKEVTCKGYLNCGSGEIEAEFYYLGDTSKLSLSKCKDKIVMIDGYLGYWMYKDLLENGALGFITYDGNANYADKDIDQRELRAHVSEGNKILGVNINAKDAIELVNSGAKKAKITIDQDEYTGESRNVVATLKGESDEIITFTAHYDSTSLSQGAYDNMSGSVGLLGIAEYFISHPHKRTLKFVWCGSEERGLLGSKAYCNANEEELKNTVLNVNLDMIGCIMGKFIACCTTEEKLVSYLEYLSSEVNFAISAKDGVYSSDSTPFADKGVPALSFARIAPPNTATIHNSYDTKAVMSAEQMALDIDFINLFSERMANAYRCPVSREIPEKMKEELDYYLTRKRRK